MTTKEWIYLAGIQENNNNDILLHVKNSLERTLKQLDQVKTMLSGKFPDWESATGNLYSQTMDLIGKINRSEPNPNWQAGYNADLKKYMKGSGIKQDPKIPTPRF